MATLTQRLEIRLDTTTLRMLEAEARRRGLSVGALVREAIRRLLEEDAAARQAAVERLAGLDAPVADWETMKREIEIAYLASDVQAALAARLGVEPERVWEELLEHPLAEREEIIHAVFRDMCVRGQIPQSLAEYEAPFKHYIEARLWEAAARRGGLH